MRAAGKVLRVDRATRVATREEVAVQGLRQWAQAVVPSSWVPGRLWLGWLWAIGRKSLATKMRALPASHVCRVLANPYSGISRRWYSFGLAECCHLLLGRSLLERGRLRAGILDVLKRYRDRGWIGLQVDMLQRCVADRLAMSCEEIPSISTVIDGRMVVRDGECVFLPAVIRQIGQIRNRLAQNQLAVFEGHEGDDWIASCLARRFTVVTGSAGSGKTASLRRLIAVARAKGWPVAATALTGKAAMLLGPDGQTLHRYLGFGPKGFAETKKPEALIVVDEASMLTLSVLLALLRVAPEARIVFAGDPRQLEPVQGIAVFGELCRSVPVVDLDRERQQDKRCPIGPVRHLRCRSEADATVALRRFVQRMKATGATWQVLAPVYDGPLGVAALNRWLQAWCNPDGLWLTDAVRVGDRVIVKHNTYDLDVPVFNGQIGTAIALSENRRLVVRFDHGVVAEVPPALVDLAYCLSIHKAQGSRYDHVVVCWPERRYPHVRADRALATVAQSRAVRETVVIAA